MGGRHDGIGLEVEGAGCRDRVAVLGAVLGGGGRGGGHLEGVCGRTLLPVERHSDEAIGACSSALEIGVILCWGVCGQCRGVLGGIAIV